MFGQQRFVGRDHMLAVGNGLHHECFGQCHPAHDLHNDIDVRVTHQGQGITDQDYIRPKHLCRFE